MSGIAFQNVGGAKIGRTRFDWHTSKKFDTDFGWIIPIMTKFCIPGDWWNISNEILTRCMPLASPVMHEVSIDTHYFYVPLRIIDDFNSRAGSGNPLGDPLLLNGTLPPVERFNQELFTTGGFDGNDAQTPPEWNPTTGGKDTINPNPSGCITHSLWDYLEYPTTDNGTWTSPVIPNDFQRRAYNLIFNEYYRDETLWTCEWDGINSRLPAGTYTVLPWENDKIQFRAYSKDYFTSALPFQQRGIAPAMAFAGTVGLDFDDAVLTGYPGGIISGLNVALTNQEQLIGGGWNTSYNSTDYQSGASKYLLNALNKGKAKMSDAITFDISDLRLTFQIQRWLERNARAGARLKEWSKGHWDVDIPDERLFRPEYIGGSKTPMILSEVVQTSSNDNEPSPLGSLGGHGISISGTHIGEIKCLEYGYIIGLMTIMPKPAYSQGFERTDLYKTRYEFPQSEFVNLSEQDITQAEIYIAGDTTDTQLFGYQGMYDELRTANSKVCGNLRHTLNYWHMSRIFENAPMLNRQFIECNLNKDMRRIFLEQTQPGIICDVEHNLTAVRPIPEIAEPGLIDHN
jgi:hypothetical protein